MSFAENLFNEIKKWSGNTFGAKRSTEMILDHLQEELDELRAEVEKYKKGWRKSKDELLGEYADVQILLWNLMDRMSFCFNHLMDAVLIKMQQNKKRKWIVIDGKMKHLPDSANITPDPKK